VMTAAGNLSRRMGAEQAGAYAPTTLRVRTQERDWPGGASHAGDNTDNTPKPKES